MKCVIPCAGRGTRMGLDKPKVLLEVNGIPILWHVINQWAGTVDGFVIIASPENEAQIKECLQGVAEYEDVEFATQGDPKGLADAILQAEPYVKGKFVVNLGDCLVRGKFRTLCFDLGIGVQRNVIDGEYWKSYAVKTTAGGHVFEVIEKPKVIEGYCGMGVYFLDNRIFDYIRKTEVMPGGGDFTEVLQNIVDAGEEIKPAWFKGEYINITYPEDLKKAEEMCNG